MQMIEVFYDGKCGLCSKEIEYYKSIAPKDTFKWTDITRQPKALDKISVSLVDGLMYLHVKTAEGKTEVGLNAFIAIWNELPRWQTLGKIAALPLIKSFGCWLYNLFAKWRFKRLNHCQVALERSNSRL